MRKHTSFLICGALIISSAAYCNEPHYPKLFFSYSSLYDSTLCPPDANPVNPTWALEAQTRKGEFSKIWYTEASKIFRQFFNDFEKGFHRKEYTVTLSACNASWSYSNPLVIRLLPFLKSFVASTPNFPLFPDCGFASQIFHELLHVWLGEHFDFSRSSLYARYQEAGESSTVLAHLHLMALQKLIYSELGRKDLLSFIDWNYSNMKDPAYPRAWEIVNRSNDYKAFVAEIRAQSLDVQNELLGH